MKWLSFVLLVSCLVASNVHRHSMVLPCEIHLDKDPTLVSFSNGIVFDTRNGEPALPESFVIEKYDEAGHYVVQMIGPIFQEWTEELKQTGAQIRGYLPKYSYIVYASNDQITEIQGKSFVHWTGIFQPAYKIQNGLIQSRGNGRITIQVFPNEDVHDVAQQLSAMGNEIIEVIDHPICKSIEVNIDLEALNDIAHIPQILFIQAWAEPSVCNDHSQWVVMTGHQSSVPPDSVGRRIWYEGLIGEGTVLSTTDTGIRTDHWQYYDSAYPINSPGVFPNHRKIVGYKLYAGAAFGDAGWNHGTHVNCTVAGDDTTLGSSDYDGIAKHAKLFFVDIGNSGGGLTVQQNLTTMYDTIYLGRGLPYNILQHSGSWRWFNSTGVYLLQDATTDAYIWANRDFLNLYAAGNESGAMRIGNPGIAKNVITVGATLNSTNSDQIASFSSRGPTQDNRIKPNLMAPGDGVTAGTGLWSADGATTSGYKQGRGTSMATPSANGGVGLIRQYLLAGFYPSGQENPADSIKYQSAALLRSMSLVSCDPNVGSWNVPDFNIGWGRLDVDSVCFFDGDTRKLIILDDTLGLNTGQQIIDTFQVNSDIPLRVCLAWTDTAAAPNANPTLINDLDLELIAPSGAWYRGNQYTGGQSSQNPSSWDNLNVEECARINNPETGVWTIAVSANNIPYGPQPFAYSITGDIEPYSSGIKEEIRYPTESQSIRFTNTIMQNRLDFEITLNQAAELNISIYDLTGRIVKSTNRHMKKGTHRIKQKIDLPAGVYFVNINAGDMQQIEKALVVR